MRLPSAQTCRFVDSDPQVFAGIEAEEDGQKAGVSATVLALVTQLADQLQGEAATEVEVVRARTAEGRKSCDHLGGAPGQRRNIGAQPRRSWRISPIGGATGVS